MQGPDQEGTGDRADREDSLADLLWEYVDRLNAGEVIDPQVVRAEHPEHADALLLELKALKGWMPDAPGQSELKPLGTLGDYTLRRQIGRGGMGIVYEAWEGSMDRRVALKILPAGIAADDRAFHRFLQEAKTAGKLSHPNVVPVYATGVRDQTPYFAMEFVEGETLAQVLAGLTKAEPESETVFGKKDSVIYVAKIADAFAAVADGLQHAHSKGVVHRDIKPSNLILDKEGRLRILDFGLARLEGQESFTISGDIIGTPQYMSPEQARRKKIPIDHRTDVYSLGATLYEALTLRPPFRGKDHQDTLSQIIERDPVEPRKINPRIPRDLETIVLKCVRKDAGDRYGTAEALAQDLRRLVRGDPIEARADGTWSKLERRLRRHKTRLATLVVVSILILAVALLGGRSYREAQLRLIEGYGPKVLDAVMKVQLGSMSRRVEAGEPFTSLAFSYSFGQGENRDLLPETGFESIQEAIAELTEAASIIPGKPDALYHRARALLFLGDEVTALRDLDNLNSSAPSFVPAVILHASVLEHHGERAAAEVLRGAAEGIAQNGWQKSWLAAYRATQERRWKDGAAALGELIALEQEGQEPYLGCGMESRLGRAGSRIEESELVGAMKDIAVAQYKWRNSLEAALLEGKVYELMGKEELAAAVFQATFKRAHFPDEVAVAVWGIYNLLEEDQKALEWAKQIRADPIRERHMAQDFAYLGRYQEAIETAKQALAHNPKEPRCYLILSVILYENLGKYEEALATLRRGLELNPSDWGLNFDVGRLFRFWGKMEEAIQAYRLTIDLHPERGMTYGELGLCLLAKCQPEEGLELLRKSARMEPNYTYAHNNLGVGLFFAGRLEEAIAEYDRAMDLGPRASWPHRFKGNALERLGRTDEAMEEYRKAGPLAPREASPYSDLGGLLEQQGKIEEAFSEYLQALEIDPTYAPVHQRISALLQRDQLSHSSRKLEHLVEVLDNAISPIKSEPLHLRTLALALSKPSARQDLERALDCALRACETTAPSATPLPGLAAALKDILRQLQPAQCPGENPLVLLPSLPPCSVIDALVETEEVLEPGSERKLIEKLQGVFQEPARMGRLAYFKGSLLERSGKYHEAAQMFTAALTSGVPGPEPLLALARCLRKAGQPAEAERQMRQVLTRNPPEWADLWNLWLAVCLVDLERSAADVLANFPSADPLPPTANGPEASSRTGGYGEDFRWLLKKLRDHEAIRINCGGDDFQSSNGQLWGRDRFYRGGHLFLDGRGCFRDGIAGTDDDSLYQTERSFPDNEMPGAYRVPLPSGRYRVTLHFAEVWFRSPGLRRFDVQVQGQEFLKDYEPIAAGFASATRYSCSITVEDGLLEIAFIRRVGNPKISAIEIERAD